MQSCCATKGIKMPHPADVQMCTYNNQIDAFRAAHQLQDIGAIVPKYSRYSYTHLKLPTAGSPNGAKMIIWPKELFDDWR